MMLYKVVVKRIDIHLECQNNLFYDISLQIYYIWGFFAGFFLGGGCYGQILYYATHEFNHILLVNMISEKNHISGYRWMVITPFLDKRFLVNVLYGR